MNHGFTALRDLFGPMRALKDIPPPERSFEDWERFLRACDKAGLAALDVDYAKTDEQGRHLINGYGTPVGLALVRRMRWLKESRRRGLTFQQAEEWFNAAMERDSTAMFSASNYQIDRAKKAAEERDRPMQELHDFAEEAGIA